MVQLTLLTSALVAALSAHEALAHPGEEHSPAAVKRELHERSIYGAHVGRSLSKCKRNPATPALQQRAVARRSAAAHSLRKRSGIIETPALHRRNLTDFENWAASSHNETGVMAADSDAGALFAANTSCVVTPEDVIGPYYVLGENIRSDLVEGEVGVPVHWDMQFIDINTCEPVATPLYVDIWNTNATGIYSGVDASGEEGGLDTTFLRGVQITDADGVVEFDTLFPGHYESRATHTHVTTHVNSTTLANGTFTGGTVTHIGQLFFDESLRSAVEATYPYNTNTQEVISNEDDMWTPDAASAKYDPFPEYIYLGSDVSDGLLMWISIGVDLTANYTSDASAAAFHGEDGGYALSDDSMGGGAGGAPSGVSGMPSGAVPSGAPVSTVA